MLPGIFFAVLCALISVGSGITNMVSFDFRSTVTPQGDLSDFFNLNDTVQLMCMVDPGSASYTIHIRINDAVTGEVTRLSDSMLAERAPATVSAVVTAQLDPFEFQCFASHNDPDGVDESALFSVFVNPFFNFTTDEVITATNGTLITSPCIASGNPQPTVELFFRGSLVVSDLTPSFTQVLQFGDDGQYQCIASTTGADQDAVFNYRVIISPEGSVELAAGPFVNDETEVTINCTTLAGPMNNFTWFMDNTMISSMGDFYIVQVSPMLSQLTVSNLVSGSEVMFTCQIENEAGEASDTIIIQVPIQDFLDVSPLNQTVDLGTTVTFNCSNPGLESYDFFWIRNHTDPTSIPDVSLIDLSMAGNPYIVENNPYLTISDVELSDGGIYACVSNNTDVTVVESVRLYIQPNVTNQLMEMFAEEGDRVVFYCMATGFPTPTYHWEKQNGSSFEVIPGENGPHLILDPVAYDDFGRYRCVATVAVHDTFTDESNDVILHVSPARSVSTSPIMTSVDHGDDVTFYCDSMGGPDNMHFWVRNASEEVCLDCAGVSDIESFLEGIALSNATIEILSMTESITIRDVNATQHGGTYFCVAINEAGYGISMSTLYVTPAFVVQPEDIKTTNGSTVEFNCEAQSFPYPSYRWEKLPSTRIDDVDEPTLEFDPVEFNNFGDYICIASINVSGLLNETESNEATLFVSPLGSVEVSPSISLLNQGEQLVITCMSMGGPNNTVDFSLEGIPFDGADTSTFTQSDTVASRQIVINNVDAALHKGVYTCEASNMAGSDSANSTVIISPFGIVFIDPMNQISSRGDDVTFACETEAGFGNSYFWFFNSTDPQFFTSQELSDEAISMNRILSLPSIDAPTNGGQYSCVVVNDAGNGTAMATLYLVPEFVVQPQNISTTAGSVINITCVAEGFPYPSIQWQFMNRTSGQFEDIPNEVENTLLFSPVEHSDFGMYRCIATSYINNQLFQNISDAAVVTVSPEGSIMLTPQNMTFDYQDEAVLTCTVEGGPMNIFEWFFNDMLVVSGENDTVISSSLLYSTLNISSVSAPVHGGNYRCEVSNPAGFDETNTYLFVSPRFIEEPAPLTRTTNGSDAILVCRAEAFPFPQYRWTSSNITIPGETDPLLEFLPVVFGDEDIYQCHASSNDLTIYSRNAALHVSPFGGVSVDPTLENGEHGVNYISICSSLGGLNNEFRWIYMRTNTQVSSSSTLNLDQVSVLDAGVYECIVNNPAGNGSAFYRLNIGPRFVESPEPTNVTIQVDTISLQCTATAFPLPNITWLQNDTMITKDSRITIITTAYNEMFNGSSPSDFGSVTSVLTIQNATVNDTGTYRCDANSSVEVYLVNISNKALVLVQDVPQAPHSLDADDVSSRELNLTWTAPHDNNAPILGYYLTYNNPIFIDSGSQVEIRIEEAVEEFMITDLHPGEMYSFILRAFNEIGTSPPSDVFVNETLEEAPGGPPQNVQAAPISATSIQVMWELPTPFNRSGEIISYDIFVTELDPNNGSEIKTVQILETSTSRLLTGLMECTSYSIVVRASTSEGPGPFSMPVIIVLTKESFPGPIDPPTVDIVNPTTAILQWEPPEDPNGVIVEYQVELIAVSFVQDIFDSRRKRLVSSSEDILDCIAFFNTTDTNANIVIANIPGTETTVTLTGLIPFSIYVARVLAVTMIGPGNYSDFTNFTTTESDPDAVVDLRGAANNGTSGLISWNAPPCPNGPITGYNVYYRRNDTAQMGTINSTGYNMVQLLSTARDLFTIVTGLEAGEYYAFHVRAVYIVNETVIREGRADEEIVIEIEDQIFLPHNATRILDTGANTIEIMLPSAETLADKGINDIRYYGVVVVSDPDSDFDFNEDDFSSTYPNLQPYDDRGNNQYYITFAWNNVSEVPEEFNVGDEDSTTAIRSGETERYFNSKLDRDTFHCFYGLIHHSTDGSDNLVIRYFDLRCRETDLGYSRIGVIVGSILVFLFLCCLLLFCIICCCVKRRKDKKDPYVIEAAPKQQKQYQTLETIILNPYASSMETDGKTVPILNFSEYVAKMHSNQDYLFTEEYSHIEPQHHPTKNASNANKKKDRYLNIPAYDHSRVVLKHCPSGSDYINANYIAGYGKIGSFIASQGPMSSTTIDFWCMVWEQDVATIVMLTNLEERGKTKCHKYWPNSPHSNENIQDYGQIRVEFLVEMIEQYKVVRTFYISMHNGTVGRRVKQYHFISWPDHGVPTTYSELLDFSETIKENANVTDGPTVVHCSAGVGRTGAFIAIYVQLIRAERERTVDIYNYVQYMRKQRPSMVLNEIEYIFIHDAIVEALRRGMIKGVVIDEDTFEKQASKY